jgi:hypothetical protein
MGIVLRSQSEGTSSFDTEDFGQAVALLSKGYEIIDMHPKENNRRVVFHFEITPTIEQAAQDYWNGKLQVDAKQYQAESKNLKTRLYGVQNENTGRTRS